MFAGENLKINHEKVCQMLPESFELEEEVINNIAEHCQDIDDWKQMIQIFINQKTEKDKSPEEINAPSVDNSKNDKNDSIEIIKETGPS